MTRAEAVAMVVLASKGPGRTTLEETAKHLGRDPYDAVFDVDAKYVASDDPQFDKGLPDHPLTECRAALAELFGSGRN